MKIYPIREMPQLALNQAIRSMNTVDQIKLSLTSNRMEYRVKAAKIKVNIIFVMFRGELSSIDLLDDSVEPQETTMLCSGQNLPQSDKNNTKKMARVELDKWCNVAPALENTINLLERVRPLLTCNEFSLVFYLDEMKKTSVKEILSIPALKDYTSLQFRGGTIGSDELNLIIEMAKPEQFFAFRNTEIPIDFRNENAFKFNKVEYEDARWVQIEDLFSLRNRDIVILGKNNLNSFHFNTFIKYWINSDCDMFEQFIIKVDEAKNDFYDGLVMLQNSVFKTSSYLVAAKNMENRKKPILYIGRYGDELMITAYSLDEQTMKWAKGPLLTYKKEYEILRLLEKKEELEKELMDIEERVQEIRAQIRKLDNKLTEYGVYYEEGIPTINPRNT